VDYFNSISTKQLRHRLAAVLARIIIALIRLVSIAIRLALFLPLLLVLAAIISGSIMFSSCGCSSSARLLDLFRLSLQTQDRHHKATAVE
jgi:hypothetical protein